jgi:hypothetical protein
MIIYRLKAAYIEAAYIAVAGEGSFLHLYYMYIYI